MILIFGASVNYAVETREIKYICKGTEFETPAYIIKTDIEKPSVMVIAGTHGNEPSG